MCEFCDCRKIKWTFEDTHTYYARSTKNILSGDYGSGAWIEEVQIADEPQSHFVLIGRFSDAGADHREIHICPMCGHVLEPTDHRQD